MRLQFVLFGLISAGSLLSAGGQEITVGIAGGGGRGDSHGLASEHYSGPVASYATDLTEIFQFSASFLPKHDYTLTYRSFGAGVQWVQGPSSKAWFVAIGAELRAEHAEGDVVVAPNQPLASVSTDLVRPWLVANFGYKGFLVPLPSVQARVVPITKLIVALPMYAKGAAGNEGALREGISGPQFSVQAGVRF